MSDTTARAFESTMQDVLIAALGMSAVYRESESAERILPCVVLKASFRAEDFAIRITNRYAVTLEFRATAMVPMSSADSARTLEEFAKRLKTAIETATISGGWNYIRLDLAGDERGGDANRREYAHIYTVTAHPI